MMSLWPEYGTECAKRQHEGKKHPGNLFRRENGETAPVAEAAWHGPDENTPESEGNANSPTLHRRQNGHAQVVRGTPRATEVTQITTKSPDNAVGPQ